MTPKHFPALGKIKHEGLGPDGRKYTVGVREIAASRFLNGTTGEEKFIGMRDFIFYTWPEFLADAKVDANGGVELMPSNYWNPWFERNLRAFTNTEYVERIGDTVFRYVGLTGCGGAGKTHVAGTFAVPWWGVDPENSIVILTSTTKEMIKRRIWPVISHYAENARDVVTGKPIKFGHMIGSQMQLNAREGDAKHAVFAMAVACGETQKAMHNLKGMHAKRILLVIDEANGTPEAIFTTIPNLTKGALEITVIIIGNPWSRMDPHGRAITPENGWGVFNENLLEWRSKAVSEWGLPSGLVLRFDGKDSPNVKAKKNLFPYIYTYDNWVQDNKPERVGTLQYWAQARGMHPPEGMSNTVFNEQLFERCNADDIYTFTGKRERMGFLDPGFGGDACKFQVGELGDVDGKMCLQLTDSLEVPIDANAAAHDIDYQIARRIIQECKTRNIAPEKFGLDATGIGRGVGAILAAEWSPDIQYMNWGSGATDRPSAQNDGRPAKEVYNNFVCELWFGTREAMESGQVKGFSKDAKIQFCSRTYEMSGKKYKIEPKPDMKERIRYSPDDADAVVGVVEVARRNGLVVEGKIAVTSNNSWTRQVKEAEAESAVEMVGITEGGWAEADLEWTPDAW